MSSSSFFEWLNVPSFFELPILAWILKFIVCARLHVWLNVELNR